MVLNMDFIWIYEWFHGFVWSWILHLFILLSTYNQFGSPRMPLMFVSDNFKPDEEIRSIFQIHWYCNAPSRAYKFCFKVCCKNSFQAFCQQSCFFELRQTIARHPLPLHWPPGGWRTKLGEKIARQDNWSWETEERDLRYWNDYSIDLKINFRCPSTEWNKKIDFRR